MTNLKFFALSTILLCEVAFGQRILFYSAQLDICHDASKSAIILSSPETLGTGTFISVKFSDTSQNGFVFVLTAGHIVDKHDTLGHVIGQYDDIVGFLNLKSGGNEEKHYRPFKFKDRDIAILLPNSKRRPFSEYDYNPMFTDDIADFGELEVGEYVFVVGYPGDIARRKKRMQPVVQMGILAFVDSTEGTVLVDVPINPGNSGCPAYVLNRQARLKLLGIVYAYEPSSGFYVKRKIGRDTVTVPANSGLGRVVPLALFRNQINSLLPH